MKIYIVLFLLLITSCKNGNKKPIANVTNVDTTTVEVKENLPITEPLEEEQPNNFNVVIEKVRGDLNKDGIADLVSVKQDTVNDNRPYRLQAYLSQPNRKLKLILSSDSAIVVRYPNGKYNAVNDAPFTGIEIKKGTLIISHELTRGSFSHQFRYQNKKFELIGFRSASVSGGMIEETDFNLSTGDKVITHTTIGNDKILDKTKSKELIKYLPNLTVFEPYTFMY
ncbi:hypothetical protein [Pedobacter jamesrossensis]|uniref:Lipoprotein n=1 Tax=Pedobacter jamesrossensis TaxID=1908238 RepID=A0ABV8NGJ2_9SPHI